MFVSSLLSQQGKLSDGEGRFLRKLDGTRHVGCLTTNHLAHFPADSLLCPGDILHDLQLNKDYLLGDTRTQFGPFCDDYRLGFLFESNSDCALYRLGSPAKDKFGYSLGDSLSPVAVGIPAYIELHSLSSANKPDKLHSLAKYRALLPGDIAFQVADRLVSSSDQSFMVTRIDKELWQGALTVLSLIPDQR